jgi:Cu+-exporting ATPase
MDVQPNQAAPKSEQGGQTYYFCSSTCKQKFDQNPKQYTSQQKAAKGK